MKPKLLIFIILTLCLSSCSSGDKMSYLNSEIKEKQENNVLNLLITYDNRFEEDFMGTYTDLIFNKFIDDFSFKNNIKVNKTYLDFSNQSDLKKKLASIAYNSNEYDIVIFNDSYVRYPFENDEIMENLEQLDNYPHIFKGLKNKYFVPMAYSVWRDSYPSSMIDELNIRARLKNEMFFDYEIKSLYFRKNNFYPTKNVMETEALLLDLDYKITEKGIEINRESIKDFRDQFRMVLNGNYTLNFESNSNYIKNIFAKDSIDWSDLEKESASQYNLISDWYRYSGFSSVLRAEEYLNGNNKNKKYDVYLTRLTKESISKIIHMGVFKSSLNKEISLKFVDEYISENHQQKLANETAASRGYLPGIINRNNIKYLSEKEERLGAEKDNINLRNKMFDDLDKEIGSFISYDQFSKEQLKIAVMYIIRPYILSEYNPKEVDKKIKELEKTINVRLFEDK